MRALPLIVSFLVAGFIVPPALRSLRAQRHVRENYRGRRVPFPAGFLVVADVFAADIGSIRVMIIRVPRLVEWTFVERQTIDVGSRQMLRPRSAMSSTEALR